MPSLNTGNAILSNPIKVDSSYNVGIGGAASGSYKLQVTGTANFTSDVFGLTGFYTRNSADTFIGSTNNTSGIIVNGTTLVTKIVSGGNTVATFANAGAATFSSTTRIGSVLYPSGNIFEAYDNDIRITAQSNANGTAGYFMRVMNGASQVSNATVRVNNTGSLLFFTGTSSDALQMTITSGGNVGIGTSSPVSFGSTNTVLSVNNVNGGGGGGVFVCMSDGNQGLRMAADSASSALWEPRNVYFRIATNDTERMRITSGGLFKFQNNGSSYESGTAGVNEFNTAANDTNVVFRNTAASLTGARAGIDVFYSAVAPNNTTACFYQAADNAGGRTLRFEVRSNGGIANYATNNVVLSDERLKKDIIPLESYWDKFKAIEIVKFKYKDQTHDDFNIGVIAQQVEAVAPEFIDIDGWDNKVKLDDDGNEIVSDEQPLKSVYNSDLHHATIKVLQEAMVKIELLEEIVKELQNK